MSRTARLKTGFEQPSRADINVGMGIRARGNKPAPLTVGGAVYGRLKARVEISCDARSDPILSGSEHRGGASGASGTGAQGVEGVQSVVNSIDITVARPRGGDSLSWAFYTGVEDRFACDSCKTFVTEFV